MIIKHGRPIFEEIHEVRKGLCVSDADWLGKQTPTTWVFRRILLKVWESLGIVVQMLVFVLGGEGGGGSNVCHCD